LDPMPAATLRRISMKALARYQVILLGEQRHIRCEQLAQGCCSNSIQVYKLVIKFFSVGYHDL